DLLVPLRVAGVEVEHVVVVEVQRRPGDGGAQSTAQCRTGIGGSTRVGRPRSWAMNCCPGPVGVTGVRRGALAVAERMTARDGEGAARDLPERVRGLWLRPRTRHLQRWPTVSRQAPGWRAWAGRCPPR